MKLTCGVRLTAAWNPRDCVWGEQEGDDPAAMLQAVGAQEAAAHRLVVNPHTPPSSPHGCPLCPANLCKVRLRCLSGGRSRNPAPNSRRLGAHIVSRVTACQG